MPLVGFTAGTTIVSDDVNANFALCVLTDTAKTVTVTHTWSSSQTFTGGWTAAAACAITSASATALTVGLTGATNSAFTVDASTGSQVAGLKVTGAVTGGTVAVVVTDSGSNTNLTVNAKGSGTIGIGTVSTGTVTIGVVALTSAGAVSGITTLATTGAITTTLSAVGKIQIATAADAEIGFRINRTVNTATDWEVLAEQGQTRLSFYNGAVRAHLSTAGALTLTSSITTSAPNGGTAAAWKLGVVSVTSPTSPNRTIELDVGGTIYYLAAKTTNN